jgi:hypothetical protein
MLHCSRSRFFFDGLAELFPRLSRFKAEHPRTLALMSVEVGVLLQIPQLGLVRNEREEKVVLGFISCCYASMAEEAILLVARDRK